MYKGLHVKYQLFLSNFNETWFLSAAFRKTIKYQISWKSVLWKPICSIRTDMTKLIVAVCNFVNAPSKKGGKVVLVHATEAHRGRWRTAQLNFTPRPLHPGTHWTGPVSWVVLKPGPSSPQPGRYTHTATPVPLIHISYVTCQNVRLHTISVRCEINSYRS